MLENRGLNIAHNDVEVSSFTSKPLSLKREFSVSFLNDNWIPLQAYGNIVNRVFILRYKKGGELYSKHINRN